MLIVLRPFVLDYMDLINYNREIENLQIESPQFDNFEDGQYQGQHIVDAIEAQVWVQIQSGRIEGIEVEHELGDNAAYSI